MTATLNDQTGPRKRPEPLAEAKAAAELVRAAKEQGLSLTGPDGLVKQLTKRVMETALNEELTEYARAVGPELEFWDQPARWHRGGRGWSRSSGVGTVSSKPSVAWCKIGHGSVRAAIARSNA